MAVSISDWYSGRINYVPVQQPKRETIGDLLLQYREFDDKRKEAKRKEEEAAAVKAEKEAEKKNREDALTSFRTSTSDEARSKMGNAARSISDYALGMSGAMAGDQGIAQAMQNSGLLKDEAFLPARDPSQDMQLLSQAYAERGLIDEAYKANAMAQGMKTAVEKPQIKVDTDPKTGRAVMTKVNPDGTVDYKVLEEGVQPAADPKDRFINTGQAVLDVSNPAAPKVVWTAPRQSGGGGGDAGPSMPEIRLARSGLDKQASEASKLSQAANRAQQELLDLQKKALDPLQVLVQRSIQVPNTLTDEQVRTMAEQALTREAMVARAAADTAMEDYQASAAEFQQAYPEFSGQYFMPRRLPQQQTTAPAPSISDAYAPLDLSGMNLQLGNPLAGAAKAAGVHGINPAAPNPVAAPVAPVKKFRMSDF